jgi:hypothetical protein
VYIGDKLGALLVVLVIALLFWIYTVLSVRDVIKEDSRIGSVLLPVMGLLSLIGFVLTFYLVASVVLELWIGYKVGQWFP